MRKGLIVVVALAQLLSGGAAQAMGLFSRGENASYSATNLQMTTVEDVEVKGHSGRSYFSAGELIQYSIRPIVKYEAFLGGAGGGNQFNSDTGHKIPVEILVTWRELPPGGSKPYTGLLKGPYRLKVREKIPKEVLQAVQKNGVSVVLSFAFSDQGVLFNWQLIDYDLDNPTSAIKVLRQGGDSFK